MGRRAAARELNRFCNDGRPRDPRPRCSSAATRTQTHEITAIGHAHIDTAWLWPLAETYRKCVRTFATPAAATWRPTRTTASRARRRSSTRGSAIANRSSTRASGTPSRAASCCRSAARWIEPDCNLPSGESLVRQFLLRPALLRAGIRAPRRGVLEPRRVRLQRPAPAAPARRRHHALPDPEAVLEPLQPARRTTRSLGRASTAARCSRTSRRPTPTTPTATVPELRRTARDYKDHDHSARACWCSASATAAAGRRAEMLETLRRASRPPGPAAHDACAPARSSSAR